MYIQKPHVKDVCTRASEYRYNPRTYVYINKKCNTIIMNAIITIL